MTENGKRGCSLHSLFPLYSHFEGVAISILLYTFILKGFTFFLSGTDAALETSQSRSNIFGKDNEDNTSYSEKAKPVVRRGRKATGLQGKIAGLPE
jgi:hypothetical protein